MHRALSAAGCSLYQAALAASQLGTALGAALVYLACRVGGCGRGRSALAAALVACTPCVAFFATVVELHGPFFAPVGAAWLAGAWLARSGGLAAALAVALATSVATGLHSSGALLPVPVLGSVALRAWPASAPLAARRRLLLCAASLAVHVPLVAALGQRQFDFFAAMASLASHARPRVAAVVWHEWLWPFAPLSVLFLLGLRGAPTRKLALVVLASLPVYLVPTLLILGIVWREFGAYLVPLAAPLAAIAVLRWTRAPILLVAAVMAGLSLHAICRHDEPGRPREFAAGVRAVAAGAPVRLLTGAMQDFEACYVALPDVEREFLLHPPYTEPALAATAIAMLDRQIEADWARGGVVLLTSGARESLRHPEAVKFPTLRLLSLHLEARYRLEPVRARGFEGAVLRPRE
jgi:hypothetical protein